MIKIPKGTIIKQGVSADFSDARNKKIELLNTYALIWMYFILVFLITDFFASFFTADRNLLELSITHLTTFAALAIVIFLNRYHKFEYARPLWLIIGFINFTVFSLLILPGRHMEFYFLILPGISLSLYDKKTPPIICTLLSFIGYLTPYFFIKVYPQDFADRMFIPATFGVFLALYFLVRYFKKLNLANEEKLSAAYEALEETKKREVAHLQLKSLKAQMNPHFMFNAMNSIQNLILKGDRNEAYNYLTKFSLMIRENLNMSEKSFVSFEEELSLLKKYLELEKLRFKDDFEYEILGVDIDTDIRIPSMIIQPFIENAIKHGLLHKINAVKKLKVEFELDDVLTCVITDNGIGIQKSIAINKRNDGKPKSFSSDAIHQRLAFLKDYYQTDIGFTYLPVEVGTKIKINIPFLRDE